MNPENGPLTEQLISEMVHRFYERVMADDSLRAIFEATIHDWGAHHRVVVDFWSRVLLNTDRYRGSPYPPHAGLPIGPEHFDRWLTLFREAAREVLPADAAERAIARAEHMAEAFKAGMFHGLGPPLKPRLGHPVRYASTSLLERRAPELSKSLGKR